MEVWLALGFLALSIAVWAGCFLILGWFARRTARAAIPVQDPRYVFRIVKREDRAAYVRIMRRTMAIAMRDFGRAATQAQRAIGKTLLPSLERLAERLASVFPR